MLERKTYKLMLLYDVVSSFQKCVKHFTLHHPADLFTLTPASLLWEAFRYAAINVQTR